jgi:hypothetical protein
MDLEGDSMIWALDNAVDEDDLREWLKKNLRVYVDVDITDQDSNYDTRRGSRVEVVAFLQIYNPRKKEWENIE